MKYVASAILLLSMVSTGGCDREPIDPLRVGMLVWPSYEIPYLAEQLGYYDGQSLQLVDYSTPAEVVRDYRSGAIDVMAVTLDYLLQVSDNQPIHKAILAIDYSQGGDAIIAKQDIGSMRDLAGRTVAVERSQLGAFVLTRALERAGMTTDDIRTMPVDTADQAQAYRDNLVDAVVTYEPVRTLLLEAGGREVFNSAEIPGEIVDVLVASDSTIAKHRKQLVDFVRGWMRALDYLRTRPDDAAERVAPREQLTAEQYRQALQGLVLLDIKDNLAMITGKDATLHQTISRLQDVELREGFIRRRHATDDMIDATVLLDVAQ